MNLGIGYQNTTVVLSLVDVGILSNSESLTLSDQCLASAANDKVVVTYVKGDEYDTAEITAGVSAITLSSCCLTIPC